MKKNTAKKARIEVLRCRAGRKRTWTAERVQELIGLKEEGMSYAMIGQQMGMSGQQVGFLIRRYFAEKEAGR